MVGEPFDFDTRSQFGGLVREWRERLEGVKPFESVVPREGLFPEEQARLGQLWRDLQKSTNAYKLYQSPGDFPEAAAFYNEYGKYQDKIKQELQNRGAIPIRERFRNFERATGIDDYSPTSSYDNPLAFEAAEHEIYSHQLPFEEGFALDYRPFRAGKDVRGNDIVIPANTVTPLNESLAGQTDVLFRRLTENKNLPESQYFRTAIEPGNVALLENYLLNSLTGGAALDDASRELLKTRLSLAYPERLDKPQYKNPQLEADVAQAGQLYTDKYVIPAHGQMEGLLRTQFPGAAESTRNRISYSDLYKGLLSRFDKAFGGNVGNLGNYFFSTDPVTAATQAVPGVLSSIKSTPSSLLPGAADLIPSPEAIRTGYAQGPVEMGKQMAQEFAQSLPTAAGAAMLLSTPAVAPFAPGIGAGLVGTAGVKALNEVVRQETGEGIVPKLRQAIGTAPRTGLSSPPRQGEKPLTAEIRPLSASQRQKMNQQATQNELQRRMKLIKERFNLRKGELGLTELFLGR